MSSDIIINTFPKFKECCDSLGITSIFAAANNGSRFVFAVNGLFPISFDIETNDISVFQFKSRKQESKQRDPLCIDISDDSKYVATGYADGSIALWSIEHNYTFVKSFQKLHTNPITQIKFGPNSNYIFASDTKGLTTIISILSISVASLGMHTFKESSIYQGKLPVQNLIISRSNGPFPIGFIIFPTYYVCFDLDGILSSTFQSTKDVHLIESETFFDPPSLALFPRTSDYFLTVSTGKSFKLLQVWSYDKTIPLINDFECSSQSGAICFSEFISNSLIVITTSNGLMELITTNGIIVCSSTSERLKELLNAIRSVLCHNEKVILVTNESVYSLSFESWDEMILKYVKEGKFTLAFQSLSEINLDLNRNLVGIPSNLSIRRRKVIELGEKLLDEYFKGTFESNDDQNCSEKVASIAMYTTTLGISDYLITKIAALYEENGKFADFFNGIQRGTMKNFSMFLTPQFLRKLLQFVASSDDRKKMDETEEMLITLNYQENQVLPVITVASEFHLLKLIKHLFLNFLNDAISPCQFFYENGRLVEYYDFIFSYKPITVSDSYQNLESIFLDDEESLFIAQKSLIVWLLLPDTETGEFARLKSLFSGDWKKASLFTNRIISMLPIRFSFFDTIQVETFVEAVLMTIEDVEYDKCEKILDQILPILPAKEIQITGRSIKHIFRWCFTTPVVSERMQEKTVKSPKNGRASSTKSHNYLLYLTNGDNDVDVIPPPPSIRENVFEMANEAFPNVVPNKYLISWCERAGFLKFIQNYYLPKKEYGKIISSMLMNDEIRPLIFDFIEENIKRPNNNTKNAQQNHDSNSGVDKEKMKVAILQNAFALLLLDPDRFVMIIETYYQDMHNAILETLNRKPHKLVYLNSLIDVVGQQGLTTEWANMIFQLSLDYDPDHAYYFLTEHINDVDLNVVERLSEKYNRVDCLVQIKIYNQQFREAIVQIGQEIERKLLNFIESDCDANPASIDELCDISSPPAVNQTTTTAKQILNQKSCNVKNSNSNNNSSPSSLKKLKEPMDMIRVAIKLLQSRSTDKDIAIQWQKMYLYFQFPMYHAAQKSKEDESKANIQNCVSLMFSFFIVSSLDSISAHHALCILCLHFSVLELSQYNNIYANIFSRIHYQKNLLRSLDEMLMIDTMSLIDNVYKKKSKGIKSQLYVQCCTCQEPLSKSSDLFNIFPCGHCYHLRCITSNKCPLCDGSFVPQPTSVNLETNKKLTTRQVQFLDRRINFALRKNFGEEAESAQTANSVFFNNNNSLNYGTNIEEAEKKTFTLTDMIPPPNVITIKLDDDDQEEGDS
ncbi:hypothetical protein M9Y10_027019 [Tritrichomonas musculus]|uniref:RING-type domain-containing protein n=1 Tax=Tritrichomonas musculus TaxID=1915356 RepID=A0ABR2H589_9EUKA